MILLIPTILIMMILVLSNIESINSQLSQKTYPSAKNILT